ncbi:YbhB/YbcL family Raf kinase inhibitor-like protein [Roseibium aggregatum]|uniref:YbhB/YbcL family Raf kinase inhibitor-like protein n=1 Tax=Roseibium aggregatum TaxID=187304 RepID=A0A926NW56_9HYPH|nr:YbhB/YbcL family Raf kinase inhibitor-like protein [Roseibium aggregatum]MBD1544908.1 YbhB/YbcL family Raf kinase inhibitor-like protein [Roseibium aggregatum]
MAFRLASPAFENNDEIPEGHTCMGANLSPRLEWSDPPPDALSFALVCLDPDAPGGTFYHWAVFDIPKDMRELEAGLRADAKRPDGLRQALNDFGKPGYGGPCPPRGHGPHHYRFCLFALDVAKLETGDHARCRQILEAARPHALATAEITGLFER